MGNLSVLTAAHARPCRGGAQEIGGYAAAVPPDLQRTMAASLGAEVVEIDTGHGPFREQPPRLAELLVAATH